MIGVGEIILCIISFCLIWYLIFKMKLAYDTKKILENIAEKIDQQKQDFFSKNQKKDLKEKLQNRNKNNPKIIQKGSMLEFYLGLCKKMFKFYGGLFKKKK